MALNEKLKLLRSKPTKIKNVARIFLIKYTLIKFAEDKKFNLLIKNLFIKKSP
ncbi:hypothetical protein GCM10011501_29580 [Thalassotalea profundi]|uniref:Uncharacterized protein n=1 Tax=Thalassotalea profundi TaxID=2036687 RepID=A0ABQ3J2C8_9GAMM|nr:hypothetical protein GCM10011501_29580 [Thalassotalea profundi]